jgi:GNAT superfamily N-acetyltransferase
VSSAGEIVAGAVRHVTDPAPELADQLGAVWVAVTRDGGSVGFVEDAPEEQIRAAARKAVDDVRAGLQHMLAVDVDGTLGGVVFVRPGAEFVASHRAELSRLMVRPDLQGRGFGRTLLDAAIAHAKAAGLEQMMLSARGGTDMPGFYVKMGWTPVGVWRDCLNLGDGERRDMHWFQLDLRPTA